MVLFHHTCKSGNTTQSIGDGGNSVRKVSSDAVYSMHMSASNTVPEDSRDKAHVILVFQATKQMQAI